MKIFIIGGSGVVGSELINQFIKNNDDVYFTYFQNKIEQNNNGIRLDITNKKDTIDIIKKINPDIVIHTAALTNVDLCETNNKLACMINVDGTKNVVEGCKITGSKIVYISTSFVFDGRKSEYYEEDQVSPSTHYGITKQKGEQHVIKSKLPYLILRTDQPYGWTKKWQHSNSVIRTIKTLKTKKELKEIVDWYNTPTYVPDFGKAVLELINRKSTGIYHVVGSNYINVLVSPLAA